MGPIQKRFEQILKILKKKNAKFALAGGYAASIYRKTERFTKDIDFLLWTENNVIEDSHEILENIGLKAFDIREADLKGGPFHKKKNKSTPIWMVAGRSESKTDIPIDFLLHLFPWMKEALDRAQLNQQDIGFGWKIPVLTAEDIILSKFMALGDKTDRLDDISDIKSIFEVNELDLPYLIGRMRNLQILCPPQVSPFVPQVIKALNKQIKK